MLKATGILQLALAPLFVVPAMTGQDEDANSLRGQLDATVSSMQYLAGLRSNAEAGVPGSVEAILSSTQAPTTTSPERAEQSTQLHNDIARLRFQVDQLLADPAHVAAITALPAGVVRALGLAGAPAEEAVAPAAVTPRSGSDSGSDSAPGSGSGSAPAWAEESAVPNAGPPVAPAATRPAGLRGMGTTTGLDDAMRAAIRSDVGPLDEVSDASRRRGSEPVPIEGAGFVADPARLGRLLVRAGRAAEAVEVLEHEAGPAGQYWLARAYQDLGRVGEAIEIYTRLQDDIDAGPHARHASQDLDFLSFRASFERALDRRSPR